LRGGVKSRGLDKKGDNSRGDLATVGRSLRKCGKNHPSDKEEGLWEATETRHVVRQKNRHEGKSEDKAHRNLASGTSANKVNKMGVRF